MKEGQPRFQIAGVAGEEVIRATTKHSISVDPKWLETDPETCIANELELAVCERQGGREGGREGGNDGGRGRGRGDRDRDRWSNRHDDGEESKAGRDGEGGGGRG